MPMLECFAKICLCSSSWRQQAEKKWGKNKTKPHIWVVEKLPQPTPCRIQLLSRFHTDEEESSEEKYGGEEFGFCMRDLYSPILCLRTDVWGLSTARFDNKAVLVWLQSEATSLSCQSGHGLQLLPVMLLITAGVGCSLQMWWLLRFPITPESSR